MAGTCRGINLRVRELPISVERGTHSWASKWNSAGTTANGTERAKRKHFANGLFECAHYSAPLLKPENIWISFLAEINTSYCGIGSLLVSQWRFCEFLRTLYTFEVKAHRISMGKKLGQWLNIGTPPYATNVCVCFIVLSLHYMFRPWSVAIFRWFVIQIIFKGSY
jgi:hypothetical protein